MPHMTRLETIKKKHRRPFKTAELSDDEVQAISSSRMDSRHAHLNALLDQK
jgi:hypothetical protein